MQQINGCCCAEKLTMRQHKVDVCSQFCNNCNLVCSPGLNLTEWKLPTPPALDLRAEEADFVLACVEEVEPRPLWLGRAQRFSFAE